MKQKIEKEVDRILEKMKTTENLEQLREYALVVESLVISLGRIK